MCPLDSWYQGLREFFGFMNVTYRFIWIYIKARGIFKIFQCLERLSYRIIVFKYEGEVVCISYVFDVVPSWEFDSRDHGVGLECVQ